MNGYLVYLITLSGIFGIFALGLNLQWGFAGLINFGHVAFMTIGAYVTVLLTLQGFPLILALAIGGAIAAIVGLLIGTSTLRLREDYLAIVTIGVSELFRLIANNEEWLTKGTFGIQEYPLPLENWQPGFLGKLIAIALLTIIAILAQWYLWQGLKPQLRKERNIKGKKGQSLKNLTPIIWLIIGTILIASIYLSGTFALLDYRYKSGLMLLVLLAVMLIYSSLEILMESPWGRIIKAIREDEQVARALGKNVFWYKLQAFMLGGAIAGIAGAFLAWQLTTVYPTNFEPIVTFNAWIIVILGGAGNNIGTLLGTIIFFAYMEITRSLPQLFQFLDLILGQFISDISLADYFNDARLAALRIMIMGLILMMIMLWRPQGILGKESELNLDR
ncbi:MAG: branched-chain amino acid ABC transporter permease [Prochloraceae cyanobacterium]|nr:branched-chain amino acid ABC transporter permease [Prochloraceae cyanobacterium]